MKFYEIQPTEENVYQTYVENTIGRNDELHHFVEILNELDTSCSIALDGDWGSGKTFFVKQAKLILDAHNTLEKTEHQEEIQTLWSNAHLDKPVDLQQYVTTYYDAWLNDNDQDPIFSLVYSIIQNMDDVFSLKEHPKFTKTVTSILNCISQRDVSTVIESLKSIDLLKDIKQQKSIQSDIEDFLDELLPEKGNRLVIFVDELDRCKPSFAVQLLERIKHYFSNDRITFVFSINSKELKNTIQQYYGNGFNASQYLNRFFDIQIALPPANIEAFCRSIQFSRAYYLDDICYKIIYRYNLQMREIAKFLKMIRIAFGDKMHRYEEPIDSVLLYTVPIMFALQLTDTDAYRNFKEGKDAQPLVEFFKKEKYNFRYDLFSDVSNDLISEKEARLEELYNALFNPDAWGTEKYIGNIEISQRTRNTVFRTAGLMSNFSDYT